MAKFKVISRFFVVLTAWTASLFIAGCANTLTTQVSNFNQWPAQTAGATCAVSTVPRGDSEKWGELERKRYESLLADALQKQGLKPAATAADARFHASLRLDTRQETVERSQPVYGPAWGAYPYGPYGAYGWPRGYWHGGVWHDPYLEDGVFGWSAPVYLGERRYQQAVGIYLLSVRISDSAQKGDTPKGATVFESSAQYAGSPAAVPELMPYLLQAVFSDFPGQNGQVRQVTLPIQQSSKP